MNVKEKVLSIRIAGHMERNPSLAKQLGIAKITANKIYMAGKDLGEKKNNDRQRN